MDRLDSRRDSCLNLRLVQLEHQAPAGIARRAIATLRRRPSAFVSVGEWAASLGVSREHLTRSLRPLASCHALLFAVRLSRALDELEGRESTQVSAALELLGYSSLSHAYAAFKRAVGMTPQRYAETLRAMPEGERPGCFGPCPFLYLRTLATLGHE